MAATKPTPLPDALRHLRPFVNALAKLPPEGLNEDVDPTRLDAALRKRVRGMDGAAAAGALEADRATLGAWLTASASAEHPAYWVLGYLSSPDLAGAITRPPEPTPRGPTIHFEPPPGWTVKVVPFALDVRCGKRFAQITAFEGTTFDELCASLRRRPPGPEDRYTATEEEVATGPCRGRKFQTAVPGPRPCRTVGYALTVPGGVVHVSVGTLGRGDFDESAIEASLGTIRLSAPA